MKRFAMAIAVCGMLMFGTASVSQAQGYGWGGYGGGYSSGYSSHYGYRSRCYRPPPPRCYTQPRYRSHYGSRHYGGYGGSSFGYRGGSGGFYFRF